MEQRSYPRTAQRAVTLRQPCRVYYANVERQTCQLIDPETGVMRSMDRHVFDRTMVLEHQCPLNVRKLVERIPRYGSWLAERRWDH